MRHATHTSEARGILSPLTCPQLSALPGIRHGFFTRNGGISTGIYGSLNCAYGTGDTPENIAENYRRICETLGVAETHLCKPHQVHSAEAVVAVSGWTRPEAPQVDAVVTATPNLALGITTADCLPIL